MQSVIIELALSPVSPANTSHTVAVFNCFIEGKGNLQCRQRASALCLEPTWDLEYISSPHLKPLVPGAVRKQYFHLFIFKSVFNRFCTRGGRRTTWRIRVSPFCFVGPCAQTQTVRVCSRNLYSPNHLANPNFIL